MFEPPANPKLYHIVHVDRLASILADGGLLCDATMIGRFGAGTMIGISEIKERRLRLALASHPGLHVGECVPFYFCPRSVMLYIIHRANHQNLAYRGGQTPIIHLEIDLRRMVTWAHREGKRWAFTTSNAGACYFEDRSDLAQLNQVNWPAVRADNWAGPNTEGKQAEFLIEEVVPWSLVERIGACTLNTATQVEEALRMAVHKPRVEIRRTWYY